MKKRALLPFAVAVVLCTATASAQFSLSGEYRPRTELSHGYATLADLDQSPSLFTSQRTRINLNYHTEGIRAGLVLQDVRTWGNQRQLVENQDYAVSLHQGWAEIFFSPVFSVKAGRQELSYDDHRILGNVGWTQQARSHDLALFKYEKDVKLHIGIAHNENSNRRNNFYDGPDAYKDMQFIWLNKLWQKSSLSFMVLNNGVPVFSGGKQQNRYSHTLGGSYASKDKPLTISLNLFYQTGKDVTNRSISALNILHEIHLKVNPGAVATFGYEKLSGTAMGETGKNRSFTPLYGTNHKFNGYMDYFFVGNHLNSVGLKDAYFKWACSRFKNVQWNLHFHYFAADAKLLNDAPRYLGTEVDFDLTYTLNAFTKITGGYSQMVAGESMTIVKPEGSHKASNYWAYLMLSVTPSFIK